MPLCPQTSLTHSRFSTWGPRWAEPHTCPAKGRRPAPLWQEAAHPHRLALPPATMAVHTGSSCSEEQAQPDPVGAGGAFPPSQPRVQVGGDRTAGRQGEDCRYLPAPRGSAEKQSLSRCGAVWSGGLVWALPDDSHSGLQTVYVDREGLQGSEANTLISMVWKSRLEGAEQLTQSPTRVSDKKRSNLPDKGPPTR